MLFGRKEEKKDNNELKSIDASIKTMPDIFYGGADPMIFGGNGSGAGAPGAAIKASRQAREKKTQDTAPPPLPNSKSFWYVGIPIFLVLVGLISWYYIRAASPRPAASQVAGQLQPVLPAENSGPSPAEANTSTASSGAAVVESSAQGAVTPTTTSAPKPLSSMALIFPAINSLDSLDLDNDSLTDAEEEIFKTESGNWDTDGDGYYDGQEIQNLYDPAKLAPAKLIDSGLVAEYINPIWRYRCYYPVSWEQGSVDSQSNQVLISSVTGDYIEVRAYKMNDGESFTDWFGREAKGENFSDYSSYQNVFGVSAFIRKDKLAAFFEMSTDIYVLIFKSVTEGVAIPYRRIMEMAIQSFRPKNVEASLREQDVLPKPLTQ